MRMLAGAHGIPGFARPKFLGDQLVGKVLYGSLYGQTTQPEVGPPSMPVDMHNIGGLVSVFTNPGVVAQVEPLVTSFDRVLQFSSQLNDAQQTDSVNAFVLTLAIADPYANMVAYNGTNALQIADAVRTRMQQVNGAAIDDGARNRLVEMIKSARDAENVAKVLVKFVFDTFDYTRQIQLGALTIHNIKESQIATLVNRIIDEWRPIKVAGAIPSASMRQIQNLQINRQQLDMSAMSFATSTDEYGMEMRSVIAQPQHSDVIREMRMDTVLARNLMHIGLVLEVVQARLARDLTYLAGDRVAEATSSIDPSIYKLFGTQTQPDARTPNYEGRNFI
jgi:hypothetical protein